MLTMDKTKKSLPALERVGLYEIEEEISRSNTATIYRAINITFQYQVALKVLRAPLQEDPAILRYFVAEGQDGMRLIHPNIVRIYDAGLSDGVACIAQAYMEDCILSDILQNRARPFSLGECLHALTDIANGLDFAHSQGHIHGNLKPSNIFCTSRGRYLVADFRVASPVTILRPSNYPTGRTTYLSPEQRRGDVILTPMSDVFSLALITFEMLVRQLPYGVDDSTIIVPYIHSSMLSAVPVEDPQAHQDIASVLNRALAVDPAQRYPTVTGFVQALAGAARNRLETLHLSSASPAPAPATTTALMLYSAAPLAVTSSPSLALMRLPQASKRERRDLSWISFVVVGALMALLVLGMMNSMLLMVQSPVAAPATSQVTNTLLYNWFSQASAWLERAQIMRYFSPVYGFGSAIVLLVLLFQRELMRTFGIGPENRYWRFLSYAIPPVTLAFVLLIMLQIFQLVQPV